MAGVVGDSRWDSDAFVANWVEKAGERNRIFASATERMLAEARVGAGSRVLDLGTGTGDTALLAASRVGPQGHVLAIDPAPTMVDVARKAVDQAGLTNVTVRVMHAESLDVADGSFDSVMGRNMLMFVALKRALREIRRVLRPLGRLATVVWSETARCPYYACVLDVARERGALVEPLPEMARAFALGDRDAYLRELAEAGFASIEAHRVASARRYASAAGAVKAMRESPIQAEPIERLAAGEREAAWAEIERRLRPYEKDGECVLPMESLVLVGERPGWVVVSRW
jgi:ubiquinone/menaquinone biosynthesis C-methylase UbiE